MKRGFLARALSDLVSGIDASFARSRWPITRSARAFAAADEDRAAATNATPPPRRRPPHRRPGMTDVMRWHGGGEWTIRTNFTAEGKVDEVFIDATKPGGFVGVWVHDSCIILSMLLQHGAELRSLQASMALSPQFGAAEPSFISALIAHAARIEQEEGELYRLALAGLR